MDNDSNHNMNNVNQPPRNYNPYSPPPAPVYVPGIANDGKPKRSFLGRVFGFFSKLVSFAICAMIFFSVIAIVAMVSGNLHPVIIKDGDPLNQIAIIELNGVIDMENAAKMKNMLKEAGRNQQIKGIIISVNCPGGMVAPSDMIAHDIELLKQRTGKPVFVSVQQLSASGAYWATAACDKIYAQTESMVGSIGVIYNNMVVKDTLDKIGISPIVIKSSRSPMKDVGSMFRMPTEEEVAEIQSDIDKTHDRFIEKVAKGREMLKADVIACATGEVFDGPEALDKGLIDAIGFLEDDVINALSKEIGVIDPQVIKLQPVPSVRAVLTGAEAQAKKLDIHQQFIDIATMPKIQAIYLNN